MNVRPHMLFLCVHNAGRFQMAAAFAREIGGDRIVVLSAGSSPGETLNPAVVSAMLEKGVDISNETPRKLTDEMGRGADVVVTMGCGDVCPVYSGKRYLDWELTDPAGRRIDEVFKWNTQFHDTLHGLVTEKRRLHRLLVNMRKYVLMYRKDTLESPDGAREAVEGHKRIVMALGLRDQELCERMMRHHIHRAREDALQSLLRKTT